MVVAQALEEDRPQRACEGRAAALGVVGMAINFAVATIVSRLTPPPSAEVQRLIEDIRVPRGAGEAHEISA